MKNTFTSLLFFCFTVSLFAQSWENPFSDVFQLDSLNVWIVGDNGTIINTKDGGNSWNDYSIDTSLYFRTVCFNTEQNGYILGQNNFNIKTTNGGETWTSIELDSNSYLSHVFFVDENHGWISAGDNGLYKTNDAGQSWIHNIDTISKMIFFDPLNGYGKTHKNMWQTIVRTRDGGLTWTEVCTIGNSALGGGDFHFADSSFGVKVTSAVANVYYSKTSDGGQTWTEIDNIPGGVPNVEFIDFQNAWFGYSCFINYSGDFFETYNTFQLPYDNDIYDISVKDYSNGWAVGGDKDWEYGRIWKLVGANEWDEILPAGIKIKKQNPIKLNTYPNPVKDVVYIKLETNKSQEITISIFNISGTKIKTIFSRKVQNGVQELSFDLNEFSDGSYFIQVKNEKSISVKKIIKI